MELKQTNKEINKMCVHDNRYVNLGKSIEKIKHLTKRKNKKRRNQVPPIMTLLRKIESRSCSEKSKAIKWFKYNNRGHQARHCKEDPPKKEV